MKTYTLIIAILFTLNASAEVVHRDLIPDSSLSYTLDVSETILEKYAIALDIDLDGTLDYNFRFEVTSSIAGVAWSAQIHALNQANEVLWDNPKPQGDHHFVAALVKGDTIGANSLFGSDTMPLLGNQLVNHFSGIGEAYIGIKFMKNGVFHYGWILVEYEFTLRTGNIYVKELAYQDIPGETLYAGLKVTGISYPPINPKLILYPNPSHDFVHITSTAHQVRSIELMSRTGESVLKMEAQGKEEVTLDIRHLKKGVYYVVLTDETARIIEALAIR